MRSCALLILAALISAWSVEALADPPAHAPAKGWRKKHDPNYVGYSGTTWERDYDVTSGRCNREEIGAVLGGVAGAVVGSKVSSPENRTVGTIIGAAVGALLGSRIGRELDESDRGCFGHVLEVAPPGERVTWVNSSTGVSYSLLPGQGQSDGGSTCRPFTLEASAGATKSKRTGKACQTARGVWKVL